MKVIKMNKPIGYTTILPDELMVLQYGDELVPMIMCRIDETEEILAQVEEVEDPNITPAQLVEWLIRQQEEGDDE